ncbi:hypothetical protein EDB87DRAFT_1755687 [Lactarius vividus]|nr:hypothetical protein EDB87DRAFT_1755687 [Lactarius vividus]
MCDEKPRLKLRPRQRSRSGVSVMSIPISHDCQSQECCIYDDSEPAGPTAATYNGYPIRLGPSNHPLSTPQSSGLQQGVPTSSHFPNTDDGFFPTRYYQDEPVTPNPLVITLDTSSPTLAGAPISPGVARGFAFYERVSDYPNTVANGPIADPVSDVGEDRIPPASSHMAFTLYDPQNITSNVLDMSDNPRPFNPQLHSIRSPNHLSTSPRSPGNFSDLLTWDNSHLGQELEAASTELFPAILLSIGVSPVSPAVARKKKRCPLCGIRSTQSQVLNRHMKDKHEDKGSCPHCSNFRWSRGRPYLYTRHLQEKHSELASSGAHSKGLARLGFYVLGLLNARSPIKKIKSLPENHSFLTRAIVALASNAPVAPLPRLILSRTAGVCVSSCTTAPRQQSLAASHTPSDCLDNLALLS